MNETIWRSKTLDLAASFGRAMPACPSCNVTMAMSCREAYMSEPLIFTFECRGCRFVMQRAKAQRSSKWEEIICPNKGSACGET